MTLHCQAHRNPQSPTGSKSPNCCDRLYCQNRTSGKRSSTGVCCPKSAIEFAVLKIEATRSKHLSLAAWLAESVSGLSQCKRIFAFRAIKKLGRRNLSSVQFLAGPEQNDFRVPRSTKRRANMKRLKTGRISPCDGEFSIAYDVSCDQSFADPYPFSWYP